MHSPATAQRLIHRGLRGLVVRAAVREVNFRDLQEFADRVLHKVTKKHGLPPTDGLAPVNGAYYVMEYYRDAPPCRHPWCVHVTPVHCKIATWAWCLVDREDIQLTRHKIGECPSLGGEYQI